MVEPTWRPEWLLSICVNIRILDSACICSSRQSEVESIQEVLRDYRACHGTLIKWIEETTAQQEMMKPGQAEDSRVLSEQLSQQTVSMSAEQGTK